jgi:putative transposase
MESGLCATTSSVMPRPQRVQLAGGIYHVMSRGVRGASLYTEAHERARFLDLLANACDRYEWQTFGYCLMGNHYHLVVRTMEPTLSRGMQWLNGCYARWFGDRHGHEGHVLFRRFHSVLVESDAQLVNTLRYVLRNPVAAGLCARPEDWRWSSYAATMGNGAPPRFLVTDWFLDQFGDHPDQARANFTAFIREER